MRFLVVSILLISSFLFADPHTLLLQHSSRPLQAEGTLQSFIPWETPIEGFFIRSHHGPPNVNESSWKIEIDGLVENPLTITLYDIRKLKYTYLYAVLECSGNARGLQSPNAPGIQWQKGAVGNAAWGGVTIRELLRHVKIKPEAAFVRIEGADTPPFENTPPFIRSVPIQKFLDGNSLLAWKMNRQLLPHMHGGPVRLVLPGWYAQNWVKWVKKITFEKEEDPSFFMKQRYRIPREPVPINGSWDPSTGANIERILVQSFITHPKTESTLPPGNILITGKAFSGEATIQKVEISTDKGKTWSLANLEPPEILGGWQNFSIHLEMLQPGEYSILARATDSLGHSQPLEHTWNPSGYCRNAADPIEITIVRNFQNAEDILSKRCLSCHARELIESQRITIKQWEGVLHKMELLGARISTDEKLLLLPYLSELSSEKTLSKPTKVHYFDLEKGMYKTQMSFATKERGRRLYATYCEACHGTEGQGHLGPKLIQRYIPETFFSTSILQGTVSMPSFSGIITTTEIADLYHYLHHSDKKSL